MKRVVLWVLLGWGIALVLPPQTVFGWFRPRTA